MEHMRGGKILRIDLGSGTIRTSPTAGYQDLWIGGRGFNAKIIYDELRRGVAPLDPDNIMAFSTGPFTGTMVPGSGRTAVSTQSAATGRQAIAGVGGYWGPKLKYAGYDAVIIRGRSEKPVYIAIDNGDVAIRDAPHLWGLDTRQTAAALGKDLGDPEIEMMAIGPAGENRLAAATLQGRAGIAAGGPGMGAVMGAKHLKAIAVRGTGGLSLAAPRKFFDLCLAAVKVQHRRISEMVPAAAASDPREQGFSSSPCPLWVPSRSAPGDGAIGCFNGSGCGMDVYDTANGGPFVFHAAIHGPALQALRHPDADAFYAFASQCQRLGIDLSAAARMIGRAIALSEEGEISMEETGGVDLRGGNIDAVGTVLEKIARQDGISSALEAALEDDIPEAADEALILDEAIEALNAPGANRIIPPHDAATAGARHAAAARLSAACDALGQCRWNTAFLAPGTALAIQADFLAAGTGGKLSANDLVDTASRILAIERATAVREGQTGASAPLPAIHAAPGTPQVGKTDAVLPEEVRREYLSAVGWDVDTGIPKAKTLKNLKLKDIARDLKKYRPLGTSERIW